MTANIFTRLFLALCRRPFTRYLLVGGSTFAIDFGLLIFFHGTLKVDLAVATTIAYWVSVAYNFFMNRHWVFNAQQARSLREHALLYGCLLTFNYIATVGVISILTRFIPYEVAKAIIVVVSISWMYPIQKRFIFHGGRRIVVGQLVGEEPRL
jgi:putative flippase GtrA